MFKSNLTCDLCGNLIADYTYEKNCYKLPRHIGTKPVPQNVDVCDKCSHYIARMLSLTLDETEEDDDNEE